MRIIEVCLRAYLAAVIVACGLAAVAGYVWLSHARLTPTV